MVAAMAQSLTSMNPFGALWRLAYTQPMWNGRTMYELFFTYNPLDPLLRLFSIFTYVVSETMGLKYATKRNHLPALTNPLLLKSATELTGMIRTGKLSCETLINAYIERIKLVNGQINALVGERFGAAIDEAKLLDRRIVRALERQQSHSEANDTDAKDNVLELSLLGIPCTVKESIAVSGQPNTSGLYSRKDIRATEDASSVRRLRAAGAIILGVTNTPEFLLWWDTDNRLYGRTNNPYDLSRIAGGSSGGEAALIAAGGSLVGLGTDLVGSIRIPAFYCGLFGHKPSSGVVSMDGVFPYCGHPEREKMSVLGPITRYAVDLRLFLNQLLLDQCKPVLRLNEPVDLTRSTFHFLTTDGDPLKSPVCDDVLWAMNTSRQFLTDSGSTCVDATGLSLFRSSFWMWMCTFVDFDGHTRLGREITERRGELNAWLELFKALTVGSHHRKITCLNVILENMTYGPATRQWHVFRDTVALANRLRDSLDKILSDDGILVLPCLPTTAPKHNGTFLRMFNCGYTGLFNVFELPVTYVTIGLGPQSGLPVGFQVVAKHGNDRLTIAVAELLAQRFGGWTAPFDVPNESP